MAAFLARRLIHGVVVVAIVATIVFILMHLAPGDPFGASMDNPNVTEKLRQSWRHQYGLDQPLGVQFVRYVGNVFQGQLGFAPSVRRPVAHVLADALPNTILLMAVGLAGGFALGIGIAVAQVRRRGKLLDRILNGVSLTFLAVPDFWLALMVVLVLGVWARWFPLGGAVDVLHSDLTPVQQIVDRVRHLTLPALTLSLLYFPIIARHQRAALMDTLPSDYVTTARAKGVSEKSLVRRHMLRNSLIPIVTLLGVAFPALLTGAVFVERVFSWPGMGLVIVSAIDSRDYQLVTGSVILAAAFVVAGSILADTIYRIVDPRLRHDR